MVFSVDSPNYMPNKRMYDIAKGLVAHGIVEQVDLEQSSFEPMLTASLKINILHEDWMKIVNGELLDEEVDQIDFLQ